jgi:CelD/BcsL family acetyltransferase involved in cellulose biosynthesis
MGGAPQLALVRMTSGDALLAQAEAWADLWRRSEVCSPCARAQVLALWLKRFAADRRFLALAVARPDGRLVAALPLVGRRLKGVLELAGMPANHWADCGELLLDPAGDRDAATALLAGALQDLPWPLIWLADVAIETPRWRRLIEALARHGAQIDVREQYRVGMVRIDADWPRYEASLSANHRRNRRKQARLLEGSGRVELQVHRDLEPAAVRPLLARGFAVEDRSWKGHEGSSVLKVPGMFEYFCATAACLADQGQLELVLLELDGRPIAFLYGWRAKGVLFTPKIGYDDAYRQFGPGQQLVLRYLRHLHESGGQRVRILDFHGPLEAWTADWSTASYPLGRIVCTTRHPLSRTLFRLYARRSRAAGLAVGP